MIKCTNLVTQELLETSPTKLRTNLFGDLRGKYMDFILCIPELINIMPRVKVLLKRLLYILMNIFNTSEAVLMTVIAVKTFHRRDDCGGTQQINLVPAV